MGPSAALKDQAEAAEAAITRSILSEYKLDKHTQTGAVHLAVPVHARWRETHRVFIARSVLHRKNQAKDIDF